MNSPEWDKQTGRLWVWPWERHRIHLEEELDYLRAQLSQKQRRNDELQEALIGIAKPKPAIQREVKPDAKSVPIQPRGIEAFRAQRRANPPEETEAVKGPFKTIEEAPLGISR
jgi:hypothetical protein